MQLPAIELLHPKILVMPSKPMEKTQKGIIIPSTVNAALEYGQVLKVSEGVKGLKAGDTVLYPKGAGVLHDFDGINYKFLNGPTEREAGEIWAIV